MWIITDIISSSNYKKVNGKKNWTTFISYRLNRYKKPAYRPTTATKSQVKWKEKNRNIWVNENSWLKTHGQTHMCLFLFTPERGWVEAVHPIQLHCILFGRMAMRIDQQTPKCLHRWTYICIYSHTQLAIKYVRGWVGWAL